MTIEHPRSAGWMQGERREDGTVQVVLRLSAGTSVDNAIQRVHRWMDEVKGAEDRRLAIPSACERVGDDTLSLTYEAPDTVGPTLGSGTLLEAQQGITLLAQTAELLDELHDRGAVHGALTRHSLWRSKRDLLMFPDFGLVPYLAGAITEPSDIMAYWAPERWKGAVASPQSDQYALAVMAWEVLVGRPRRTSTSDVGVVSVEALELDMFTRLRARDPKAALMSLKRALAPEPTQRYPTCGAFASELVAAVGIPDAGAIIANASSASSGRGAWRYAVVALVVAAVAVASILLLRGEAIGTGAGGSPLDDPAITAPSSDSTRPPAGQ